MKREYVWISTNANEAGTVAVVMAHHKTADQAKQFSAGVSNGGYEGPVPKDMYPVGKEIKLTEDAS